MVILNDRSHVRLRAVTVRLRRLPRIQLFSQSVSEGENARQTANSAQLRYEISCMQPGNL